MTTEEYKKELLGSFKLPIDNYPIEELIKIFENGKERFQTDVVLEKCVWALSKNENPMTLLDQVLNIEYNPKAIQEREALHKRKKTFAKNRKKRKRKSN